MQETHSSHSADDRDHTLVPADAWVTLVRDHWGKSPLLLPQVVPAQALPAEWTLALLQSVRASLADGQTVNCTLFDRDNFCVNAMRTTEANPRLVERLPDAGETQLDHYIATLQREERFEQFALYLDRPHRFHAGLWLLFRRLLQGLYAAGVEPRERVTSDIFVGNYQRTPFGIHKDKLHNLMLVSQGSRTMHFWQDRDGDDTRWDPDSRVSLQVRPGDLLYWPPGVWHVGENPQQFAVSVNIDIWEGCTTPWVEQTVTDTLREVASPVTALLAARKPPRSALRPTDADSADGAADLVELANAALENIDPRLLELRLCVEWAKRVSSAGLSTPLPLREAESLSADDCYRLQPGQSIVRFSQGGRLILACNGHVTQYPDSPEWQQLVDTVNSGRPFTPAGLAALCPAIDAHAIECWLAQLLQSHGIIAARPNDAKG